jgi:diaminopropionate ammonia-lyase
VILPHLNREVVKEVQRLLEGVGNKETPLVSLEPLTKELGIKNIFFKDEGKRLGIQSFKGPGGTFALINTMCKHLGKTSKDFTNLNDLNV